MKLKLEIETQSRTIGNALECTFDTKTKEATIRITDALTPRQAIAAIMHEIWHILAYEHFNAHFGGALPDELDEKIGMAIESEMNKLVTAVEDKLATLN